MSEEVKEEEKAEAPVEEKKAVEEKVVESKAKETPVEEKKEAPAEEAKKKKINQMSVAEIDTAIKKTQDNMHGMTSKYAKALLAKKEELAKS